MSDDMSAMRYRRVEVLLDLGAVDGVVGGDVEIVHVFRNHISLGNVGVVLVRRASESVCLSDALGLLECLVSPYSGIEIGCLVLQEIHCDIEELKARSASEEHHFMGIRNVKELFPVGADFVHHLSPLFGTVGY